VRKPEGYLRTAAESCFCVAVFCVPYWHSLLLAGITGSVSFLCFSLLLMFVVGRAPQAYTTITACLKAVPLSWVAAVLAARRRRILTPLRRLPSERALAPSFQRPPPLFS
jgi:hypothetical protein